MTDLEKARAEVARLEKLNEPATITQAEFDSLTSTVYELRLVLGFIDRRVDSQTGESRPTIPFSEILNGMRKRLTKLEAKIAARDAAELPTVALPPLDHGTDAVEHHRANRAEPKISTDTIGILPNGQLFTKAKTMISREEHESILAGKDAEIDRLGGYADQMSSDLMKQLDCLFKELADKDAEIALLKLTRRDQR